ncbi:hypothetical protein DMJ13_25815 [halophilic archaeon]|nr:hypothetical protein DMJ13_25815 [halophilic archaeon]
MGTIADNHGRFDTLDAALTDALEDGYLKEADGECRLGEQIPEVLPSGHLRAYVYSDTFGNFMYNTQLFQINYARVTESEFSKRPLFMQKMQTA